MKSFKKYLTEVWGKFEIKEEIFRTNSVYNLLPIFPSILNRVFGKSTPVIAYHSTGIEHLDDLYTIQKSKKSISTILDVKSFIKELPLKGIETSGGVAVVLKSKLLSSFQGDAWSQVDNLGRRWVRLSKIIRDLYEIYEIPKDVADKNKKLNNEFTKVRYSFIYEYGPKLLSTLRNVSVRNNLTDVVKLIDSFKNINKLDIDYMFLLNEVEYHVGSQNKEINKFKGIFIKEYIDVCEKFMNKYKNDLLDILFVDYKKSYESIVNEIEIVEILFSSEICGVTVNAVNDYIKRFHGGFMYRLSDDGKILLYKGKPTKIKCYIVDSNSVIRSLEKIDKKYKG
jgi:hypothetical protein